eukprot:CAMPEP_0175024938 /NCGR_PEP_ID=MMETSP0005-20121125/16777_1 /TAXON_ID=420556 /ORGANISM="Ochromonas sp., Strain CCMP1393" /LENGTH=175 /DNA_ID=CAMNT_0016283611 /DNA_START=152 /DNA_END=679 /DNA_ORIENTATION=+
MAIGKHGEDFKFLPCERGSDSYHFPRIVPVAGTLEDLTKEDYFAVIPNEFAPTGNWVYDFSDADSPQLGTVAVPGSILITEAYEPVAIITTNTALGINCVEEVEMVAVVDRGDKDYESTDFYLFADDTGKMFIRWMDRAEFDSYEILGRVMVCMMPFTEKMKKPKSGFLEDDDGI